MIPSLGVADAYGGFTAEYYNAFGFFILSKKLHSKTEYPKLTKLQSGVFSIFSFFWHQFACKFTLLDPRKQLRKASRNIVYILIFIALEFCLVIDGVSQFYMADGFAEKYAQMQKVAGAFGFIAGLLGYYCTAHYLCEDALGFSVPMGQMERFYRRSVKIQKDVEA